MDDLSVVRLAQLRGLVKDLKEHIKRLEVAKEICSASRYMILGSQENKDFVFKQMDYIDATINQTKETIKCHNKEIAQLKSIIGDVKVVNIFD